MQNGLVSDLAHESWKQALLPHVHTHIGRTISAVIAHFGHAVILMLHA
jgi:hypothetical protein